MKDLVRTHDLRTAKLGKEEVCIREAFRGHRTVYSGHQEGRAFIFNGIVMVWIHAVNTRDSRFKIQAFTKRRVHLTIRCEG
jgi:hypothetical protein